MPKSPDFPPKLPKKTEETQNITLHSFEDLGTHVAGVSDGIDEPSGGGGAPPEKKEKRETLHLKKNPERIEAAAQEEVSFNLSEERKRANQTLDGLKKGLYAEGISPAQVSGQWSKARDAHDQILKTMQEYQAAPKEEKDALAQSIKTQINELENNIGGELDDTIDTIKDLRPKTNHPRTPETTPISSNLFRRYTASEAAAFPLTQELKEKKARLAELEAEEKNPGGRFNTDTLSNLRDARESEFLKTEQEVRDLEAKLTDLKPQTAEAEPLTHKETAEKLKSLVEGYEGEAHYPVPAVRPEESPAQTPEVIRIPDLRGQERDGLNAAKAESNKTFFEGNDALTAEEAQRREFYFQILKTEQRARGAGSVWSERLGLSTGDPEKGSSAALRDARRGWIESRAAIAKYRLDSLEERRAKRGGHVIQGLDTYKGKDSLDEIKIRERYQRRFIVKDVVFGAEEAEQKMRIDSMESRDRLTTDKLYNLYKKLPPKARIFMSVPGMAFGTTALLTGAALPILAIPLGAMALGSGMRWHAETLRERGDLKGHASLSRKAGFTSVAAASGMGGNWLTRFFNRKSVNKADTTLAKSSNLGDLGDAETFAALSRSRQEALASKQKVDNLAGTVGFGAALAGGVGSGAALGALTHPDVQAHAHMDPHHPTPHHDQAVMGPRHPEAGPGHPGGANDPVVEKPEAPSHTQSHQVKHEEGLPAMARDAAPQEHSPEQAVHYTEDDVKLIQEWEGKYGGLPPHSDEHIGEVIARLHEDNGPDAFKDVHFEVSTHETPVSPEAGVPVAPEDVPQDVPETAPEPAPVETHTVPPAEAAPTTPEPASVDVPANEVPVPAEAAPVQPETPMPADAQPAPAEAPVAPTAPEASPAPQEQSDTSSEPDTSDSASPIETTVVNTHGLEIDKVTPHIYADKQGALIAYGGTTDEQLKMVTKFLKNSDNFGKTVHIMTSTPDPITGYPDVVPFMSQPGTGSFGPGLILRDSAGVPILPPGDNDFVKKIL